MAPSLTGRSAVLLGASGLVGGHLFRLLATDSSYSRVLLLTRRSLGLAGGKVGEELVDFERPETFRPHVGVEVLFCCLGTTRKKAGSEDAFRKVDFDAPVTVAREGCAAGAAQFVIVTAVGADPTSRVFYNRVKGETEAALRELDFPGGVSILRPSLLLGTRPEPRPAERVAAFVMRAARPLFSGGMARFRAIDATAVARAMVAAAALKPKPGLRVYEGEALFALTSQTNGSAFAGG